MSVTFFVSKLDKFTDLRVLSIENMAFMFVTLLVSKLDKSKSFNAPHPANI